MYHVICAAHSFTEPDNDVITGLRDGGCRVSVPSSMEELAGCIADADGIIAGQQNYTAELLAKAERLKVISVYGVGFDKIDTRAAAEAGIVVTTTPGANNESVADMAMALMLSAARNIPYMDSLVRARHTRRITGTEMFGKTLGVIGTGRIGKGVIRRAHGFDMKILCCDMRPDEAFAAQYGAVYTDMDTLLRGADFVTIHSPLTEQTRNMISGAEFKKMKSRAVIVNTARGGIIDEDALYHALKSGEIAAAGLDVSAGFMAESPLRELPNCVLVPHAGASTDESLRRMASASLKNLFDVLETGASPCRVN